MKKLLMLCLGLAVVAPAASHAAGVDVSWTTCALSTGAATNQVFACAASPTTNRTYSLYFQFKLDADYNDFIAFTGVADLQRTAGGPLTPFWRYDAAQCAGGTVKGVTVSDAISAQCEGDGYAHLADDNTGAGATEAIAAYLAENPRPGAGRFILLSARSTDSPIPLAALTNYYALQLNFNNRLRTTCAGCADQMVLVFQEAILESNTAPSIRISGPDKLTNCVSINNAPPEQCGPVPVRNSTWGKVKSLYR